MGQYSSRDIGVGEDTAGEERVEDTDLDRLFIVKDA